MITELPTTRLDEWASFHPVVTEHIEKYANAQYGDKGNDQLTTFTPADIKSQLQRYVSRIGSDMRGMDNALRDCLKMAHYACVLWHKYNEEEDERLKAATFDTITVDGVMPEMA